jgi:hypothetical protein
VDGLNRAIGERYARGGLITEGLMKLYMILYRSHYSKNWSVIGEYFESLDAVKTHIALCRKAYKGTEYKLVAGEVEVLDD